MNALEYFGKTVSIDPSSFLLPLARNFRKVHLAPLALAGFTSVEQYVEACRVDGRGETGERISEGCYVNAHTDVQRIRGREIRRIVKGDLSREERLKDEYIP